MKSKIFAWLLKDSSQLNKYWWYRLIKVVFILFVILVCISTVAVIISDYQPRQVKDYKISCTAEYTNRQDFFARKDAGLYFYSDDPTNIYKFLDKADKEKLRELCDISSEEADEANAKGIAYVNEQVSLGTDQKVILNYYNENFRPYSIVLTDRTEGSYLLGIIYSLVSVLVILIVAELLRRIFYYVSLGTFSPKNE